MARMDGVRPLSATLLDPGGDLEERGFLIEEALLQPGGEHCVYSYSESGLWGC